MSDHFTTLQSKRLKVFSSLKISITWTTLVMRWYVNVCVTIRLITKISLSHEMVSINFLDMFFLGKWQKSHPFLPALVTLGFLNAVAWEYPWTAILVLWKSSLALLDLWILFSQPTGIFFVKVNNRKTKTICEICNAA